MTLAIGFRQCGHLGCARRAMTTGRVHYAFCETHTSEMQTRAFGSLPGGTSGAPSALVPPADRHTAVAAVDTSR